MSGDSDNRYYSIGAWYAYTLDSFRVVPIQMHLRRYLNVQGIIKVNTTVYNYFKGDIAFYYVSSKPLF